MKNILLTKYFNNFGLFICFYTRYLGWGGRVASLNYSVKADYQFTVQYTNVLYMTDRNEH